MHQLHRGKLGIFDIGILGTFAQLFLEEVRHKTRRGLEGRAKAGKNTGGRAYGYRSVLLPEVGGKGTGSVKDIVPTEAAVIREIFEHYAAGKSPREIAANLNTRGVPSPRGRGKGSGHWKSNTIYGNRSRGTGILNNELYSAKMSGTVSAIRSTQRPGARFPSGTRLRNGLSPTNRIFRSSRMTSGTL
ncbi:hypothetical protein HJ536_20395 [Donghicola sp. B5-SW-15]|uniref:Recombinase domain-containing protein n=1 Tax=Donghicola mangrovi TaxID=2729614 RepID=A0A850Q7D7_9RHOB|nr:recombinase family protein [Donghicola mangrovi]NVO25717.1 hypothetical protein [Donghicola mangrovi]